MRLSNDLPTLGLLVLVAAFLLGAPAVWAAPDGPVFSAGGQSFATWRDYFTSSYFQENGKRCGKPKSARPPFLAPSDCTFDFTNPSTEYATTVTYEIPVVVHIIESTNGDGQIPDELVHSQIEVLNEDFRALAGTPGAGGSDVGIQFVLASTDPDGHPTTGITRTVDDTWFADGGSYWTSLAWDTSRYLNIYTNEAGGNLGYVPDLPQAGLAGDPADRVVILWSAFGRNATGGPPYDQGRTTTHEVGHYLGLEHTFEGGCASASAPGCYSSGDLICDTHPEANPVYGCPASPASCGSPDPKENYMDYSDDTCMEGFTEEQSRRMRCSLLHYRPDLHRLVDPPVCGNDLVEAGEECDGADPGACPTGICDPDCTCEDPVCGNGVTESGEDCDGADDAACPGACSPSCQCPAGCGDGVCDAGESATSCPADCGCGAAGACGDQSPDGCWCDAECLGFGDCCPDVCASCAISCSVAPACSSSPASPCRDTATLGATLTLKAPGNDAKDRLVFKIRRGGATDLGDFLAPLAAGTTASLCLYDASGTTQPVLAVAVASGGQCGAKDCWKATSSGFKYSDKSGSSAGVTSVRLKAGEEGKAQVQVKAKGSLLDPPAPPLAFPLLVQFRLDDGTTTSCWESSFDLPLRNEPGLLKTKGP